MARDKVGVDAMRQHGVGRGDLFDGFCGAVCEGDLGFRGEANPALHTVFDKHLSCPPIDPLLDQHLS